MRRLISAGFVFFLYSSKELERTEWGMSGRADTEAPLKVIQSELKGGAQMVFSITVIKIFSLVWLFSI